MGSFSSMIAIATSLPEGADKGYKLQLDPQKDGVKTRAGQFDALWEMHHLAVGKRKEEAQKMIYSLITYRLKGSACLCRK